MMTISGTNNVFVWAPDGIRRIKHSFFGGNVYGEPLKGERFIWISTNPVNPVDIPTRWEEGELSFPCVKVEMSMKMEGKRMSFIAPCAMSFRDLQLLCWWVADWRPDHAHVMEHGGVGSPSHVYFWTWDDRAITDARPSWETGKDANWNDIVCEAGDNVSLDYS